MKNIEKIQWAIKMYFSTLCLLLMSLALRESKEETTDIKIISYEAAIIQKDDEKWK